MAKSHFSIEVTNTLNFIEFKISMLQYAIMRMKRKACWVWLQRKNPIKDCYLKYMPKHLKNKNENNISYNYNTNRFSL